MRKALLLLLLATPLLAAVPPAAKVNAVTENNASCDIGQYPAATLLLPHFEVDINSQATKALNTIFTVINTSRTPQMARVTLWTDLGYPGTWFNMFLSGYDAQTISLYEILARGRYPLTSVNTASGSASIQNLQNPYFVQDEMCNTSGGMAGPMMLQRLQKIFTTGERDEANCRVGTSHKNAVGYVTIDVINSCAITSPLDPSYWTETLLFDNVLTGEYERINPESTLGNYAGGNPLVHIRAVPEGGAAGSDPGTALPYTFYDRYTPAGARKFDRRQPLPSTFSARFIEGGRTGFQTNYVMWRETLTAGTKSECDYALNAKMPVARAQIVRFDEHENALALAADAFAPASSSVPTTSSMLPPMASADNGGWLWISLDNGASKRELNPYSTRRPSQNWMIVQMYSEGRYGVDFDASWLANGCTATPPAAP
ncbi:MAG TPA: hypothetical protein VGR02_17465 [Thermoanaerobaculia bacterium]|jgi:hypothetical protein|nr:hypothetical protein [Thermoanaerobaculia bacterium]